MSTILNCVGFRWAHFLVADREEQMRNGWSLSLLNDEHSWAIRVGVVRTNQLNIAITPYEQWKKLGCLVYLGGYTTQLYRDYNKSS